MSDMLEVVREWAERDMRGTALERERQIRLALQPKPRWLPERVYRRVLARLLVLEEAENG